MPRLGIRTARTRGAAAATLAAGLLAAGMLFTAPAGASNQSVTFTITPIHFGAVTIGTSSSGVSIVTNTSSFDLHFLGAHPGTDAVGAEYHASAGTCTTAIAPGATCDVDVAFVPNATGLRASTLTVRMGEENSSNKVIAAANEAAPLVGRGVKPTFTLSGANAGQVNVGAIATADATFNNNSSVPLVLASEHLQGVRDYDFSLNSNTCPSPILPGGSCEIVVSFTPHHVGNAAVTLTVSAYLQGTFVRITRQSTITGDGVLAGHSSPPFSLSPLNFGTVTVGTTASGQVVLTNLSKHDEELDSAVITQNASGAYALVSNNCPAHIASGASCDFTISYTPAAAVIHNSALVVRVTYLNAKLVKVIAGEQTSLTGQGQAPQFSLSSSGFAATTVGASSSGTVTITNDSLVGLSYADAFFQGADQSSWALSGSACVSQIAPGQSCDLSVTFSPRQQGELSITIEVQLQLTVRSHTSTVVHREALFGKGVLPKFSVSAPNLSSTPKGVAVTAQSTVTNNSSVSLTYDGYGFTGANPNDFSIVGGTCTGPATIAPGASCSLVVQFDPTASSPGTESATLTVTMLIPGLTPVVTTANSVAVSGQES